jgi:hypothetical protein
MHTTSENISDPAHKMVPFLMTESYLIERVSARNDMLSYPNKV